MVTQPKLQIHLSDYQVKKLKLLNWLNRQVMGTKSLKPSLNFYGHAQEKN